MNFDDPKLSACALGELDPAERAEIERELASSPDAQRFVEDTQQIAEALTTELKRDGDAMLSAEAREKVLAAFDANQHVIRPALWRRPAFLVGLGALAACLALAPFVPWYEWLQHRKATAMSAAANNEVTVKVETENVTAAPPSESATITAMLKSGTLAVATSNTYTGTATVNNGTLALAAPTQAALAPVVTAPVASLQASAGHYSVSLGSSVSIAQPALVATLPVTMGGRGAGRREEAADEKTLAFDASIAKSGQIANKTFTDSQRYNPNFNTESYAHLGENPFLAVNENPLSTFSIDVDTASYANVRRFLNQGQLPPAGAVRIEELVNYFSYDYPQPAGEDPFSVNVEINDCPWQPAHRLARIGLKGREIAPAKRPPSNLVFLIDVSGSMEPENKLPLLKASLRLLVEKLTENDRVSIVVYAGNSGLVLPPTNGGTKEPILDALTRLEAGGSTNGAAGIQLAYDIAEKNFVKGGVNRVILATDGDFNVGVTSESALVKLIEAKAKTGVFLSVLGFGDGNLQDSKMESLADHGNGNYAYIDSLAEGRKVLVEQAGGTLVTIAKDVKIQVEFNPVAVSQYRLIGYEDRMLRKEDFNDDKKDAGEIGAGHTVTALYEIAPTGADEKKPSVDPLKYQPAPTPAAASDEMMTVKLRYKQPDGDTSKLLAVSAKDASKHLADSSRDFRFAAAVAGFGMLLRESEHKGSATWDGIREIAVEGKGTDTNGYRSEFIELIDKAKSLQAQP